MVQGRGLSLFTQRFNRLAYVKGLNLSYMDSIPALRYGYISPGLPVGVAHLLSREILSLAARPASESSEVDHVTTPLQRQAGSARFISRLCSGPDEGAERIAGLAVSGFM